MSTRERPETTRLTLPETARRLGISEDTVRRWIKTGQLPAVMLAGRYRIRTDDADRMMERG